MDAITLRAFGMVKVLDCVWTVADVRRAVRADLKLVGSINVTLGTLAGIAAHVDDRGDLLVVHVGRAS